MKNINWKRVLFIASICFIIGVVLRQFTDWVGDIFPQERPDLAVETPSPKPITLSTDPSSLEVYIWERALMAALHLPRHQQHTHITEWKSPERIAVWAARVADQLVWERRHRGAR